MNIVQTVLYPIAEAVLPRLTTLCLSKAENGAPQSAAQPLVRLAALVHYQRVVYAVRVQSMALSLTRSYLSVSGRA